MMNCRIPQLKHQKTGTPLLVENPMFFLGDDMGTGKSKTLIDAVCQLYTEGKIQAVMVVCPKTVKSNWTDPDPEKGEIAKHGWLNIDHQVYSVNAGSKLWPVDKLCPDGAMQWVIVNYDIVWRTKPEAWLRSYLQKFKTAMVLDESHCIKKPTSQRTKGCIRLSKFAARRYALSGTPITRCPLDIYAQMQYLDWEILGFRTFGAYRFYITEYNPNGFHVKGKPVEVAGYKNVDKILIKIAPWYRRVEKKDAVDLPPKVYTRREVELTATQVKLYKEMKKALVTEYEGQKVTAAIALTKIQRLAQIAYGYLRSQDEDGNQVVTKLDSPIIEEIVELIQNHDGSTIVFFQEHPQCEMLAEALTKAGVTFREIHGKIGVDDRKDALEAFKRNEFQVFLCQQRTGGIGVNMTAADLVVYFGNADDHGVRAQSEDRAHRIGQVKSVTYVDMLATVDGKPSILHKQLESVKRKESLASLLIKNEQELADFLNSL